MNIFYCACLWGLAIISAPTQAALTITTQPDWVIEHQPGAAPTDTKGFGTSYLLFDQQLDVTAEQQTDFTRIVAQINNASGLSEQGKISLAYDPSYQSLQVHHVHIIRNGQVINVLEQLEFELIRQEAELDQGIYNGRVTALLLLEDLQINDTLDYAFTKVGKNPIFNNHVFEVFSLEWGIPVADLHIRVTVPKDKKLQYRTLKKQRKPKKTKQGERQSHTWHLSQIPAMDYQGGYPKWYEPRDYLEISEFKDWQQVATWASEVFAINLELDVATTGLVRQWQQRHPDELTLATKALQFVQDEIRYLGIEIGINSHQPRVPAETYATKYGDCKDKTMLLHAMLRAMDIESKPFLVSTELDKSIVNRLPSPGLFNHVILQIELAGSSYWVDPTTIHQGSLLNRLSLPDFAYGLVIDAQTKRLSPMARKDTQVTLSKTVETLQLKPDAKTIPLSIETQHQGEFAEYWRSRLANTTEQQIQNQFESHTNQMYGLAAATDDLQVVDDVADNLLTIAESYELQDAWQQNNRYEFIDTHAHSLLSYVEMPSRINRDSPLALAHPLTIEHQFIIDDPSKKMEFAERDIDISTPHLSYQKSVSKKGQQITITHQLKTLSDHAEVDDLKDYYDTIKTIKGHLSEAVGLPIKQKKRIKESNDRLKSALQDMLKEKKK
ncbi:DUF3857 domain-containing transglutaminase family protein [Marinicella meishanensis]|uniref:DUF3857 domain-containing transglutaminase family protein n=1 Tax=Marinicella meishanensis TaxID=2873263 RepID=UPI001CBD0D58|nr:DUF3857 domain-containing transglutaminase family protein [Marinicella sp. NBU2979]